MGNASHNRLWISTLAFVVCGSGCFLGYDSRWGDEARAQKVVAKKATPDALQATPTGKSGAKLRVMRLRVYMSDRFATEVGDEESKVMDIVASANDVLGPTLDLQLDMVELRRWDISNDNDLGMLLDELEAVDDADDVDWVAGFVGKPATLEMSFGVLGKARVPGKHMVMRAMNDAAEYDAIQKNFGELDDDERADIYRKRLAHKEAAVFLHELGHTLGVPHTRATATLMHPVYDHEVDRFSHPAARLMRINLDHRLEPSASSDADFAKAVARHLETTSSAWLESERASVLAMWRERSVPKSERRPESFSSAERWQALSASERERVHQVLALEAAGKLQEALSKAEPLAEAHPDGYEIQELRCRLAMRQGGDAATLKRHCEAFEKLDGTR